MQTCSIATDTHELLAIRAEIRTVPNLFGGPADLQGWVQAPERAAQFVGFVVAADGAPAVAALEANVRLFADDIVMDLGGTTPPPAVSAVLPKPKRPKSKKPACTCPLCQFDPQAEGLYYCLKGREYVGYAGGLFVCASHYKPTVEQAVRAYRYERLRRAA